VNIVCFFNYRNQSYYISYQLLATSKTRSIGHSFRVGFTTVAKTEQEMCEAVWTKLQPTYIPEPTREIRQEAARGFCEQWDVPNCIGSTDGKHVTLKYPKDSGSQYFPYLQKCSLVLMATVGPVYKFICADILRIR